MKAYFCHHLSDDSCNIFILSYQIFMTTCQISQSIYQKIIIMIKKIVSSYDILEYLESLFKSTCQHNYIVSHRSI